MSLIKLSKLIIFILILLYKYLDTILKKFCIYKNDWDLIEVIL